jgi:acetyl-CoA acyltransferase
MLQRLFGSASRRARDQTHGMPTAVIVDAIRTPLGKRNGKLKNWHPVDLAATTLTALEERNGLDPEVVDDVVFGCVMQVGEQAINVARNAVLAAGWPESVPGTTVDRQCGSSQQAAHFAAQGVMAGAYDIVVAGGVEVMTRVPMGSSMADGKYGYPFGPQVGARYAPHGGLVPQGISAELIADRWQVTRAEMDRFAAESQRRAATATAEGRFEREIVPVEGVDGRMVTTDEGIRDTTPESLAMLKPAFLSEEQGGRVTAGNSSQITDGAAALLIMSEERARDLGLRPRARFVEFALAGADPRLMLTAPMPATEKVLARSGLTLDDIDLVEINEAFASVVLAWQREFDADLSKVNVNGGAIALGHPLGCSGARLMTTLLNELERTGGRYGLQTMCEGGGMANATILERLA